jgi:hypothetical protein
MMMPLISIACCCLGGSLEPLTPKDSQQPCRQRAKGLRKIVDTCACHLHIQAQAQAQTDED